jgi:hypothetical protein
MKIKFNMTVKHEGQPDSEAWVEPQERKVGTTYAHWSGFHPENPVRGRTQKAVEAWCRGLIRWFNATRRPGERARIFVSAEIVK